MFLSQTQSEITVWLGNPTCQAGHDQLLHMLTNNSSFFLPPGTTLSNRQKGNLGEFITMIIATTDAHVDRHLFAPNAIQPLSDIARPDIDLLWLFLGQDVQLDVAIIQEIKTTGDPLLGYASALIGDYQKLFGPDPHFTLQSRLQVAMNSLEYERGLAHLCDRVEALSGVSPQTCPRIKLRPTLVHERAGADPVPRLTSVRSSIAAAGWPLASVEPWSIALNDLDDRLLRLAMGKN